MQDRDLEEDHGRSTRHRLLRILPAMGHRTPRDSILAKYDSHRHMSLYPRSRFPGKAELPCPLTEGEIASYIVAYDTAAHNAVHLAGFDGVDVHAANDYLVDQFIQSVNNTRTNKWSGGEEGRTRFAMGSCRRLCQGYRGRKTGNLSESMECFPRHACPRHAKPDPNSSLLAIESQATFSYLVRALRDAHSHMANLHITKARTSSTIDVIPAEHENNDFLHEIWHKGEDASRRIFMSAGGDTRETALNTAEEKGDLVCSFL